MGSTAATALTRAGRLWRSQVASLALKHRQNKHQRQRIIIFVGSPLMEDQKELVKLGKKLKKNDVAVDVINFGETALRRSFCTLVIAIAVETSNCVSVSFRGSFPWRESTSDVRANIKYC